MHEVFFDDFVQVGAVYIRVPCGFRIDHDHRAFGTTVQAAGSIDADLVGNRRPQFLNPLFDVIARFLSAALLAALRSIRPQVGAKENVIAIIGHFNPLQANIRIMTTRYYTPVDTLLINLDQAIRTLLGRPATTGRPNPTADRNPNAELQPAEQLLAGRLMRVNHTGEVCAQALYQGQALTAHLDAVRDRMEQAAVEENDHLAWCEARLKELDSHTSILNPLFYAGAFALGALAGKAGDRWSLGFVAETEHQVVKHLDAHLERLPVQDQPSRAILEQMKEDEARHATNALAAGGARLPLPIRLLMKAASKVMTQTTYWV